MIDFGIEPAFQARLAWIAAFADGPTDAHRLQLARALLKQAPTAPGMFPGEHIPTRTAAARARYPQGS